MARGRVNEAAEAAEVAPAAPVYTHDRNEGTWHEAVPEGVKLYKFLTGHGRSPYQSMAWPLPTLNEDGTWTPGEWVSVDPPYVRCVNGLHLTTPEAHKNWVSTRLFEAEVEGGVLDADTKWVAGKVRLIREYPDWDVQRESRRVDREHAASMEFEASISIPEDEWQTRARAVLPHSLTKWTQEATDTEADRIRKRLSYLKGRDLLRRAQTLMGHKLTDKPGSVTARRQEKRKLEDKIRVLMSISRLTSNHGYYNASFRRYLIVELEKHGPFTLKQLKIPYMHGNIGYEWPQLLANAAYAEIEAARKEFIAARMAEHAAEDAKLPQPELPDGF